MVGVFFPDWFEELKDFKLRPVDLPNNWSADYNISLIWLKERVLDKGIEEFISSIK